VEPRQVSDWFHATYVDAFDWVVEPNVLAMGTFGAGEVMTTKPYIAGAGYIDRMSDYCGDCQFSPKRCPLTRLYWAYLDRHSEALSAVPRIKPQLLGLRRRSDEERAEDRRIYARTQELLQRGEMLSEKRLSEDR
ncbi:MAG: deoxyribodipyrimidine photolyase, partial [Myxococcota bacterium]